MNLVYQKLSQDHITSYPETSDLYNKLAEYHNVERNNIILTTGIDGGIRNCFDLFVKPQSKVIYLEPTFAMVDIYCSLYKANRVKIKYNEFLDLDYEKILYELNADIDLLIIANPNSPTGTLIPKNKIIKILEKCK